jgi:site-specific recombinase XerD
MIMHDEMRLEELIQIILETLEQKKYSQRTIKNYRIRFNRLLHIAKGMGTVYPSEELFNSFLNEVIDPESGKSNILKMRTYSRCINLLTSVMESGGLDCSRKKQEDISAPIDEPEFRLLFEDFLHQLTIKGLNDNTICSYKRIVSYFLIFCQEKGYTDLGSIKTNDVTKFIMSIYRNGYFKPTTITSALSGFRQFLSAHDHTKQFLLELPSRLPNERKIIEVYEEQELIAIHDTLSSDALSKRDIAISKLLMETGLRGIDVCELKLTDIDWDKDIIRIIQDKTKQPLNIPLRNSYGNAIADYILNERPDSVSEYLFLRSLAPYEKLEGAGAVWCILKLMEVKAGIRKECRMAGSRFTRHNAASTMLRAGIPMSDISAALGHKDPNIVTVYLSTDDETLASCTLPIPPVRKRGV